MGAEEFLVEGGGGGGLRIARKTAGPMSIVTHRCVAQKNNKIIIKCY